MTQILTDLTTECTFQNNVPFVLLSKLLNVLGETDFLVYDLLTLFSHACNNLKR